MKFQLHLAIPVLSLFFFAQVVQAAESVPPYSGQVFIDNNANGLLDAGEATLEGVSVSDGLNVVQTDAGGRFELPGFERTRFIQITIPSGYSLSSPFFQRISGDKHEYNFGIVPDNSPDRENGKVRMIQISDTETPVYGDWITDIRDYALLHEVDFIMHNGDICYEPGMRMHAAQFNTSRLGTPVFYTVGNHDLIKNLSHGEALYEELFGPTHYSFEIGATHFVVTPMPIGDAVPSYTTEAIIEWLRNDLQYLDEDKYVVFVHHRPASGHPLYALEAGQQKINLLDYRLKAWFNGHWHTNYIFEDSGSGVYNITTAPARGGGKDNSPARFVLTEFDREGIVSVRTRHPFLTDHAVLASPDQRGQVTFTSDGRAQIILNAYDSKREVMGAKVFIYTEERQLVATTALQKQSEWSWAATMPQGKLTTGMLAEVHISYSNGKTSVISNRLTDQSAGAIQRTWIRNVGAPVWKSSPLLVGGLIVVATAADTYPAENTISAIDQNTGEVKWVFPVGNGIRSTLQHDPASNTLLATDVDGQVYALNALDGKVKWTKTLQDEKVSRAFVSGGVLADEIYYTGSGVYLKALNIHSGETKWANTAWSNEDATSASMLIHDGLLITGSNWTSLFGHDLQTGELKWRLREDGTRYRSSTGHIHENLLYLPSNKNLYILDPEKGEIVRQKNTTYNFNVMSSPSFWRNLMIVATADAGIVAFDKDTFEEIWKFTPEEALLYTGPYTSQGSKTIENTVKLFRDMLIFGASDGKMYLLNPINGQVILRYDLGSPIISDVVTDDSGKIFIADYSGNVHCFELNIANITN